MSVCTTDNLYSTTNSSVPPSTPQVSSPPNKTTYRKAVGEIRSKLKNASGRGVHIYAFNVRSEQLEFAHTLLDKLEGRKSMRVTYSDDHNFIIRHMSSIPHEVASSYWSNTLFIALLQLTPLPHAAMPPGCIATGSATYELGTRKKEPDAGVLPYQSNFPSVILEVGDSQTLTQLKIDARLWIEHVPDVRLVILLSMDINAPINGNPTLSKMTIQLWRGFAPLQPPCSLTAQQGTARMVWEADWTHSATPLYILLSDIFAGHVPASYGNNDRVQLDTVAWRQAIISRL